MIDWDIFWKALGVIFPILAALYTFIATRRKDLDARLDARDASVNSKLEDGDDRMDRHENRIARIEQTISSMPGKDDMHALQLELVKQTGAMNEMRAVMEGNAKIMARLEIIVSRHEDHLLDGGKK
ncbi:Protein of unknown function [Roseovarius azorensis]|uniref:DUF2730 family protein n=1 Tax=Roseovarius azorensis TaxID=1287727 RepID=A0A1H7G8I1_9RHOB|nr:DUF2730 family protein [Roseovarius azorensis]SEK33767.1 Protein of unknown function [Roseovarius azorensis]